MRNIETLLGLTESEMTELELAYLERYREATNATESENTGAEELEQGTSEPTEETENGTKTERANLTSEEKETQLMELINENLQLCVVMNKATESDGQGGFTTVWTEGAEFNCSITRKASAQQRLAEKTVEAKIFTIYLPAGNELEYYQVFKRLSDDKTFRVTSDSVDLQSPESLSLNYSVVTAEEYTLV